jgi:hypothetical protein
MKYWIKTVSYNLTTQSIFDSYPKNISPPIFFIGIVAIEQK